MTAYSLTATSNSQAWTGFNGKLKMTMITKIVKDSICDKNNLDCIGINLPWKINKTEIIPRVSDHCIPAANVVMRPTNGRNHAVYTYTRRLIGPRWWKNWKASEGKWNNNNIQRQQIACDWCSKTPSWKLLRNMSPAKSLKKQDQLT